MWNQQEEKSEYNQDQIGYSEEMFYKPEIEVPVKKIKKNIKKDIDEDDKI
jgi:hypothetical protein